MPFYKPIKIRLIINKLCRGSEAWSNAAASRAVPFVGSGVQISLPAPFMVESKKIVVLDSFLKPIFGGGQTITNTLFKYLSKDLDVKFIADKLPSDPLYSVAIPSFKNSIFRRMILQITKFRIAYKTIKQGYLGLSKMQYKFITRMPKFLVNLIVNKEAIKIINESQVIISNSFYDPLILKVADISGKKIIKVNHLPLSLESIKNLNVFIKDLCEKNNAKLISVVLSSNQVPLSKDLGIETMYIPNGIETKNLSKEVIDSVLTKFDLKGRKFIFSVGRLQDSQKGFSLAIRAVSMISDIIYVIAGNGPDMNFYKDMINSLGLNDRVKLVGFVSDDEKLALMHESSAFLQPSYFESFSIVTLEALSQGAIVLVSKNDGSLDIIDDGGNGFFISLDPDDISKKIKFVIGLDNKISERIKSNAIQTANKYSAENMVSKYRDIIDK